MKRACAAVLMVLTGWVSSAQAQDQGVTLEWKFTKDAVFYQRMVTTTNQKMTIGGQSVSQDQTQDFVFKWKVESVDEKEAVLSQTIHAIEVSIKVGGNTINYRSKGEGGRGSGDTALKGFFHPLIDATFRIKLKKAEGKNEWTVAAVEGREEFLRKLEQGNPAMGPILKAIVSEENLKQMAEPAFAVLPPNPVMKDSKWKRSTKLSMGALGSYTADYQYTYVGAEKKTEDGQEREFHTIKVEPTLTYQAPAEADAGGLPFKIEKDSASNLKTEKASGKVVFDASRNRVHETESTFVLVGSLKVTVDGTTSVIEIEQTQSVKTTTHDTDPTEKAPAP